MNAATGLTNLQSHKSQINLVTFSLAGRVFALPIEPIRQIIEMVTITPLPQVDGAVEGVINFHGAIVPVINLCTFLSLPKKAARLHTPIILVTVSGRLIGFIVDDVQDIVTRTLDKILSPAEILPGGLGEVPMLRGLVQVQDKMVMLLDLDCLLKSGQDYLLAAASSALAERKVKPEEAGAEKE